MELRTFIKATLLDILHGVEDAQKEAPFGCIAPSDITKSLDAVSRKVSHLQPVDFEVSVRADESKESGAKIGVVGSLLGGGVHGEKTQGNETASILRFSVPIHLPLGGNSAEKYR